jgi:hypothetical protein
LTKTPLRIGHPTLCSNGSLRKFIFALLIKKWKFNLRKVNIFRTRVIKCL